jgi:hypothetical protein
MAAFFVSAAGVGLSNMSDAFVVVAIMLTFI